MHPRHLVVGLLLTASLTIALIGLPTAQAARPEAAPQSHATHSQTTAARHPGHASMVHTMLKQVNRFRARNGKPPLVLDRCLSAKARDLNNRHTFSHFDHQPMGPIMSECGYTRAGENIGYHSNYSGLMPAWKASRGHRANLLSSRWSHIGLAVRYDAEDDVYWATQDFAGG